MPLYEYECTSCHRRTEKILKFSDADLTICPHCGGPLERTLTAPNVQFKGGGWYKDLYSSAKPASNQGDSAGGSSGSSDSSASGSESKASGSGEGSKSGGSKSGDSKSGDSKSGDSASSASAPSAAPAASAPAASAKP